MNRRFLMNLTAFVFAGAIVNIIVAWGCGLFSVPDVLNPVFGDSLRNRNLVKGLPVYSWEYRAPGIAVLGLNRGPRTSSNPGFAPLEDVWPPWVSLEEMTLWEYGAGYFVGTAYAQGWPMLALYCESPRPGQVEGGMELASVQLNTAHYTWVRIIALRPIWPGFVFNTMFYAAVLWVLFALPFALRRRIRIKRGQCAVCGYPIAPSTVCCECGTAVTPRAIERKRKQFDAGRFEGVRRRGYSQRSLRAA